MVSLVCITGIQLNGIYTDRDWNYVNLCRLFNARLHHLNLILDSVECIYNPTVPTPCMMNNE